MARMHNSTDYVKFLEKSHAPFLRKVAKTSFLGHFTKMPLGKIRKISKIRLDRFFSLKCPLLRAKFRKKLFERFPKTNRDERTDGRTDGGDSIGPFGDQ